MSPQTFWRELGKLIELPKNCREFTLHCKMNEVVTAECVCYPDGRPDSEPVTTRYRLEPIEEQ